MKAVIVNSKYLILIAVVSLLITFVLALYWVVAGEIAVWVEIITSSGKAAEITLDLIKVVDALLIIIVLYLLAASIYNLFIGDIDLPSHLIAHTLSELKSRLSAIIVLVMVVRFAEYLFDETIPAMQVFWLGAATALVAGTLIAFDYFSRRHEDENNEKPDQPG